MQLSTRSEADHKNRAKSAPANPRPRIGSSMVAALPDLVAVALEEVEEPPDLVVVAELLPLEWLVPVALDVGVGVVTVALLLLPPDVVPLPDDEPELALDEGAATRVLLLPIKTGLELVAALGVPAGLVAAACSDVWTEGSVVTTVGSVVMGRGCVVTGRGMPVTTLSEFVWVVKDVKPLVYGLLETPV